jgi:membrane-bound serine protease (ClpP class)
MDAYVIVALVGLALLAAEALLPTGGALGAIGVAGLLAAGIIALATGGTTADWVGGALIALSIASGIALWIVARKVYDAHRNQPVRGGTEEMIGTSAEARTAVGGEGGRVFTRGGIWSARLAEGSEPVAAGSSVLVEAVDGLTLVVRAAPRPVQTSGGSAV